MFSPRYSKLRACVERSFVWARLCCDYFISQDETTRRLKEALRKNRWHVYPATSPESGGRFYSSLRYPSAEAAQEAFARTDHALVYGRDGTPDGCALAEVLRQIDPAAAVARVTGHGMAAIEAALLAAQPGDHIVASRYIFGTTKRNLLELVRERGVTTTFVDGRDPDAWEEAIQSNSRVFFFEPLGNPGAESIAVEEVARIAHAGNRDILVISDNSSTPFDASLMRGADVVALSTTKLLGLGIDNGGAILASGEALDRLRRRFPDDPVGYPILTKISRKGLTQSHRSARAMLKRAGRSSLRFSRQSQTATALVRGIAARYPTLKIQSPALDPNASRLSHSFLFAIDFGSRDTAFRFINALAKHGIDIVNNFGSLRTTVINPATTTQSSLSSEELAEQGISPALTRISVGLESVTLLLSVFGAALRETIPHAAAAISPKPLHADQHPKGATPTIPLQITGNSYAHF